MQEQLAAIRQEKQKQFDLHRANEAGSTPSFPSDAPPAPCAETECQKLGKLNPSELAKRLGPDATIGDLLADAPKKKPRIEPKPPAPLGMESENAQVILEVKQAPPKTLRLLSWNIDGIDNTGDEIARTVQVCSDIIDHGVSVIFLQEVVGQTLQIINRLLNPLYHLVVPPCPEAPYFCIMLLQRDRVKIQSPVTMTKFETQMGRELMGINVIIDDTPVYLSTAHLESTKPFAAAREKQFTIAITKLMSADASLSIFGGDLNLRDDEAKKCMKATSSLGSYQDAWVSAGQPPDDRFTWDMQRNDNCAMNGAFKPRCRFDRIYSKGNPCKKYSLIGTQRVADLARFPSDHFGVLMEWDLSEAAPTPTLEKAKPAKAKPKVAKAKAGAKKKECILLDSD